MLGEMFLASHKMIRMIPKPHTVDINDRVLLGKRIRYYFDAYIYIYIICVSAFTLELAIYGRDASVQAPATIDMKSVIFLLRTNSVCLYWKPFFVRQFIFKLQAPHIALDVCRSPYCATRNLSDCCRVYYHIPSYFKSYDQWLVN